MGIHTCIVHPRTSNNWQRSICQIFPTSGKKEELIERLEATVDTALLDENDDDLDQAG